MANTLFAQKNTKAIVQVLNEQCDAWNKADLKGYMQGYWQSDSLVFIGKNGPKYGWTTTLKNYEKSYSDVASMGILNFTDLRIKELDKQYAYVTGLWHLARKEKGDLNGAFTLLMRKINGKWVIVSDHSS